MEREVVRLSDELTGKTDDKPKELIQEKPTDKEQQILSLLEKGEVPQLEILEKTGMPRNTLNAVMKKMKLEGTILVFKNPKDKRENILKLSEKNGNKSDHLDLTGKIPQAKIDEAVAMIMKEKNIKLSKLNSLIMLKKEDSEDLLKEIRKKLPNIVISNPEKFEDCTIGLDEKTKALLLRKDLGVRAYKNIALQIPGALKKLNHSATVEDVARNLGTDAGTISLVMEKHYAGMGLPNIDIKEISLNGNGAKTKLMTIAAE